MSRQTQGLTRRERLARLKSDIEMRRFSAFRQTVEAARLRIAAVEQDLQRLYDTETDFSVSEARLANAIAQELSRALLKAERDLQQMLPGFEAARIRAQREFGRAEVLKTLQVQSGLEDRLIATRKREPQA